MVPLQLLLNREGLARIRVAGSHGRLGCKVSWPDGTAAVVSVTDSSDTTWPCPLLPKTHFLNSRATTPTGRWGRADAALHVLGLMAATRGGLLPRERFASSLSWPLPTAAHGYPLITYAPDAPDAYEELAGLPVPEVLAWWVLPAGAQLMDLELEPQQRGIAALAPGWPVAALEQRRAVLVGVGSIGSAVAHALALYGLGELILLDPDRLRWHNLVRHRGSDRDVGRHKVLALRDDLAATRPDTRVEALTWDVVVDADRVRGLLPTCDIVICCADGVAPRRVISHLARRAGIPTVLGCVLDDGAVGEVMRLEPWTDHGCLTCRRDTAQTRGEINPEPTLEAGYGTGSAHRPMTAVGGDLHLVADLTAATTIATLLRRAGEPGHRLPGEHVAIGLAPRGDLAAPFDTDRALDLRWSPATPPRPGCRTCAPADPTPTHRR